MKSLITLIIIVLPSIIFSQDDFSFPESLLINPNSFEIKRLNIKRIEQYHTTFYKNIDDSSSIDTSFVFDYIIEYDSLNRVSSFKYDFQIEYRRIIFGSPKGQIEIYAHNDSSRLEKSTIKTDTNYYNYHENVFSYNEINQLDNIQIIRPFRGGIIDGVYISTPNRIKIVREETYIRNQLIKTVTFSNDEVYCTETYHYRTFDFGETPIFLIQKIIREYSNKKEVFNVNYHL